MPGSIPESPGTQITLLKKHRQNALLHLLFVKFARHAKNCLSVDCICTVNKFAVMVLYWFSLLWMAKNMNKLLCYDDFISATKFRKTTILLFLQFIPYIKQNTFFKIYHANIRPWASKVSNMCKCSILILYFMPRIDDINTRHPFVFTKTTCWISWEFHHKSLYNPTIYCTCTSVDQHQIDQWTFPAEIHPS